MGEIIYRMEHLPGDPREDNPLKITNDARKAGLDYRLIDADATDFSDSKVNAAVERVFQIWKDTTHDLGTQLVFCDLSTPKGKFKYEPKPVDQAGGEEKHEGRDTTSRTAENFFKSHVIFGTIPGEPKAEIITESPAEDAPVTALSADVIDDEEEARDLDFSDEIEEGDDEGRNEDEPLFQDDAVTLTNSNFSVYDDMKRKLIDKGIPPDQVAFIHDANTDDRKAKLFADVQAGRVRVLIGSTSKMGAGMNVQKRLVAAHHLDAPWRPSDLEQRNGRIIRQKNLFYERDPDNFQVQIFYYATKQTYDARMWQTIEYKAAAIEQFRKGDLLQRVIDDVQSEAANAAEMKAAASGNPLILTQVKLASDLRKLEAMYSQHQRSQHRMKDRLRNLTSASARLNKAATEYADNLKIRDTHTSHYRDDKGKEKIRIELLANGRALGAKDEEALKKAILHAVRPCSRTMSRLLAMK